MFQSRNRSAICSFPPTPHPEHGRESSRVGLSPGLEVKRGANGQGHGGQRLECVRGSAGPTDLASAHKDLGAGSSSMPPRSWVPPSDSELWDDNSAIEQKINEEEDKPLFRCRLKFGEKLSEQKVISACWLAGFLLLTGNLSCRPKRQPHLLGD